MSREIKFRCWNAFSSHMHQWEEMVDKNKIHLLNNKNKSYVCEQYTGLNDKNGVEIYEGDILKANGARDEHGATVKWLESGWQLGNFHRLTESNVQSYDMIVIGNIHQNPELLD